MPLGDLIESPPLRAFGRAKRETLPLVCRDCEVLDMCHGECPKNRFVPNPRGGPALNYLCPGYRAFFNHIRPFVKELAALHRGQTRRMSGADAPVRTKTGRNDPCPCGSGKKYKKCCLGK